MIGAGRPLRASKHLPNLALRQHDVAIRRNFGYFRWWELEVSVSSEFATSLAEMRLWQTARLLEWMLENAETDLEAISTALGAVRDAHSTIKSLSPAAEAAR